MTTFAVVVTSYNYRRFVEEAVDGALAQSRPPAQVIVVDDGSTDGSPELLRARYADDPRVVLACIANGGQLAAFAHGLDLVQADVACFLDADDRWQPGYLQAIGAVYDARGDIDAVFSDVTLFGDEQRTIAHARQPTELGHTAVATYALTTWYGAPTSALSLRTPLARRCLDLPADMATAWRLSADNCLVYGASLLGGRKQFLPTGCVGYRIHGGNGWWSNRGPTQRYLNRLRSRALVAHYARVAGLDDSCLELAKLEYLTKPRPDFAETRRYMSICLRSRATPWKRAELAASVFATWLGRHAGRRARR